MGDLSENFLCKNDEKPEWTVWVFSFFGCYQGVFVHILRLIKLFSFRNSMGNVFVDTSSLFHENHLPHFGQNIVQTYNLRKGRFQLRGILYWKQESSRLIEIMYSIHFFLYKNQMIFVEARWSYSKMAKILHRPYPYLMRLKYFSGRVLSFSTIQRFVTSPVLELHSSFKKLAINNFFTTIFLFRIKNVSPLGTLFTILHRSKILTITITMIIMIMILPN